MTITFSTLNTGSHPHGPIVAGPWDVQRQQQQFFGLEGEVHLVGRATGRSLTNWITLTGYASHSALHTGIETLSAFIGVNATLTMTIGADSDTYTTTTLMGFSMDEEPFYDGSGVNGWQTTLRLQWRQIKS